LDTFVASWSAGYPRQNAVDSWLRLATGLADDGLWDDALQVMEHRRTATGRRGLPQVLVGDMALQRKDIPTAVRMYQSGMDAYPNAYGPWLAMARLAASTNQRNSNQQAVVGDFLQQAEKRGAPQDALDALRSQLGMNKAPEETDSTLPERTIIR